MSRTLEYPAGWRALLTAILTAIMLGSCATRAQAQRRVELISFTNTVWRYEASGADQMSAWRSRTFDDAGWISGLGLLGFESTPANYAYPFNTTFIPFDPNIITYYFRTHFEMAESNLPFPLTLVCSNLVDDGCVVYLNSNEVHRIRVPAGQNFVTLASGGPTVEGAFEPPVNISTNGLRAGDNVIAVEVHQASVGSGDIVHGLSLTAIIPTALSITSQPQSLTMILGAPVILSVGIAGGPALYQWQRDNGSGAFTNVPGATFSSYTNTPTVAGTASYQVVVSNGVNSVTSDPAIVTAVADTFGPKMLSAVVLEDATRTNRILITWNERLLPSTVNLQSASNFQVIMFPSNIRVGISNVQYNPNPPLGNPPIVVLTMNSTNWYVGSNYYVSVSRVKDSTGNVIAPDSRIAVAWPRNTDVIQPGDAWSFHNAAVFEPDIFEQPWTSTNYVESSWWGEATGPFCAGTVSSTCLGDVPCAPIGFQPQPALFRTTFVAPASPGTASQLRFGFAVDDAVAFYLNGTEMFRYNLPSAPAPLTSQSKSLANLAYAVCVTNLIPGTNLFPGTNWLAAAVFQTADTAEVDTFFYMELRHTGFIPGSLPEVPVPRLNITTEGMNRLRLWWNGPGYALESTTNLAITGSGPIGPWLEVTNMSNPFVDVLTGERRFFRLRQ